MAQFNSYRDLPFPPSIVLHRGISQRDRRWLAVSLWAHPCTACMGTHFFLFLPMNIFISAILPLCIPLDIVHHGEKMVSFHPHEVDEHITNVSMWALPFSLGASRPLTSTSHLNQATGEGLEELCLLQEDPRNMTTYVHPKEQDPRFPSLRDQR